VKGVDIVVTNDVWAAITGLKIFGVRINKGNLGVIEEIKKCNSTRIGSRILSQR